MGEKHTVTNAHGQFPMSSSANAGFQAHADTVILRARSGLSKWHTGTIPSRSRAPPAAAAGEGVWPSRVLGPRLEGRRPGRPRGKTVGAALTHAGGAVLVLPADADEDEPLLAVRGRVSVSATQRVQVEQVPCQGSRPSPTPPQASCHQSRPTSGRRGAGPTAPVPTHRRPWAPVTGGSLPEVGLVTSHRWRGW